jgi:hypothetical protein
MAQQLNNAAMSACIALLKSMEAIEDLNSDHGVLNEIQFGLVKTYHELTDALSLASGINAKKVSRDIIISENELLQVLLVTRKGGVQ